MTASARADAIRNEADKLGAWWDQQRQAFDTQIDQPLYHYTDAGGMRGMIEGEKLWFTSIFQLNDPREFQHGLDLAGIELKEHAKRASGRIAPMIRDFCEAVDRALHKPLPFGYYVCCFSADSDELGQWRAYGSDGRGFAVGFGPRMFAQQQDRAKSPVDAMFVAKINYETTVAQGACRDAIREAEKIIADCVQQQIVNSPEEAALLLHEMSINISAPFLWGAVSTKAAAYQHERETRLVIFNDAQKLAPYVDTRISGSRLVPYIPHPIDRRTIGGITDIVIGPAADSGAEESVHALLARHKIESRVTVRRSGIAYRSGR